jgi:hypothetical protein
MRETPLDGHFSPRVREAISKLEQAAPAAIPPLIVAINYNQLALDMTVETPIWDTIARLRERMRHETTDAKNDSASHVLALLEHIGRWAHKAARYSVRDMCLRMHNELATPDPAIVYGRLRLAFDPQAQFDPEILRSAAEPEPVWHYYLRRAEAEPPAHWRHLWCARRCPSPPDHDFTESIRRHERGRECRHCSNLGAHDRGDSLAENRTAAAVELEELRGEAASLARAAGSAHRPLPSGLPRQLTAVSATAAAAARTAVMAAAAAAASTATAAAPPATTRTSRIPIAQRQPGRAAPADAAPASAFPAYAAPDGAMIGNALLFLRWACHTNYNGMRDRYAPEEALRDRDGTPLRRDDGYYKRAASAIWGTMTKEVKDEVRGQFATWKATRKANRVE